MVEYNDIIQDGVASLSNEWFEKKERTFKAHKNYNPKLDIIRIEEIWTSPSYSIGGPDAEATEEQQKEFEALIESLPPIESIEEERITEVTLRQYCSCYLPIDEITGWGSSPVSYDVMDKSNNVPELAWAMVHDILAISKGIDDFVAITKFVYKVLSDIGDQVAIMKDNCVMDVHKEVLDDFLGFCIAQLNKKFAKQLTAGRLINDYRPKFDFNLTQEQLVAFLYIMKKAGFLRNTDLKDKEFLEFCFEHFNYRYRDNFVSPSSLGHFNELYRENVKNETDRGARFIKNKLCEAMSYINLELK